MAEREKQGFIFYYNWYHQISKLEARDQLPTYRAICEYASTGENTVKLSKYADIAFELIKPQIDANQTKYINGSKGGRPRKETKDNEDE